MRDSGYELGKLINIHQFSENVRQNMEEAIDQRDPSNFSSMGKCLQGGKEFATQIAMQTEKIVYLQTEALVGVI